MVEPSPEQHKQAGFVERDACPCCGASAQKSKLKAAANVRAEDVPPQDHGRFLSGYTSERTFFSYVQCEVCDMVYCPIFYDETMLAQLYEHQPENMAETPFDARKKTQIAYADLLPKKLKSTADFLEIGADIGLFAAACAERYELDHFTLYEPNVEVHDTIRCNLPDRNLTIREGLFPADDQSSSKVSLAAMIHVLDHVIDPASVLENLYDAVAPGGVVLIVTHNVDSLMAKVLGRRWPPFTLQHPHLFSPATMEKMLQNAGFCEVEVKRSLNYFPVMQLVRAAFSVFGIQSRALPELKSLSVGLRLGNIATLARKPG